MGLNEIKKLLNSKKKNKKTVTRLKTQLIEWEKIFSSCMSDKTFNNQNF
jgi:hypothetical protein